MPRHVFTEEEYRKGYQNSVKLRKKQLSLWGREMDNAELEAWIGLARTALAQPVVSGTVMYFLVELVQKGDTQFKKFASSTAKSAPTGPGPSTGVVGSPMPAVSALLKWLGANVSSDVTALFSTLEYDALKAAILVYIATGGNLAGLLQSAGSTLPNLLQTMGIGGSAGAGAAAGTDIIPVP